MEIISILANVLDDELTKIPQTEADIAFDVLCRSILWLKPKNLPSEDIIDLIQYVCKSFVKRRECDFDVFKEDNTMALGSRLTHALVDALAEMPEQEADIAIDVMWGSIEWLSSKNISDVDIIDHIQFVSKKLTENYI